ncbi:glycoside hydrolase [Phaeosphaeriaceae sp. PMI808]|nr:glycoside hydrolase [Phaeosphaeriaceae sp. PMI808]
MKFSTPLVLAAAASSASAHTIFLSVNNGKVGDGVRVPTYDGPINDVSSNDIVCNGGPNPTAKTSTVITLQAGSTAKLTWRHTLISGPNDVIDPSHKGPVMAYLKKVSDAKTDSGIGGGWFKIHQDSFDGSKWGVERLIANQGVQTITIPQCIAPGQYLLRGELIALHSASSSMGAQFYMECAQINITGGSASKTPATVSFPGAYKQNDAGIIYNLYNGQKTYTTPGPAVFTC